MARNYGLFGFGKKRPEGMPRRPFLEAGNVTQFAAVVVIGIVLISIISGIVGIWYEEASKITQQVALGVLLLVILLAALIPFMLIRRSFAGFQPADFVFIILSVGVLIFLLVVTPKLFNLPEIFTVSRLELVDMTQAILGFP